MRQPWLVVPLIGVLGTLGAGCNQSVGAPGNTEQDSPSQDQSSPDSGLTNPGITPSSESPGSGIDPAAGQLAWSGPQLNGSLRVPSPDSLAPYQLQIQFDHRWIWSHSEGDSVQVDCYVVDRYGNRASSPTDLRVRGQQAQAIDQGNGRFSFRSTGLYQLSCESASLGLSTMDSVVVNFEGFDYHFVQTLQTVDELPAVLQTVILASQQNDAGALQKALVVLEEKSQIFGSLQNASLLVPNPNGWPTPPESSSDALWAEQLVQLTQDLQQEQAVLESLGGQTSPEVLSSLADAYNKTSQHLAQLALLKPTAQSAWAHLPEVQTLLRQLADTSKARCSMFAQAARLAHSPSTTSLQHNGWALLSQYEQQAKQTYDQLMVALGSAETGAALYLMSTGELSVGLPPQHPAPSIKALQSSDGQPQLEAHQGFRLQGAFNADPQWMRLVLIPPRLSSQGTQLLERVNQINRFTEENNALKLINAIQRLEDQLNAEFASLWSSESPVLVLSPLTGNDKELTFAPLASGLNCNRFLSSNSGTLIPIDAHRGRGAAFTVSVVGEPPQACQ